MVDKVPIQIIHITKTYRNWLAGLQVRVIEDFTLNVGENQIVVFHGPNGSGKSTLLRMLATLLSPSSGDILIYSQNTRHRSRSLLQTIGFMSESLKFHGGTSGLDFLTYLGKLQGISQPKHVAAEKMTLFGLTEKWHNADVSIYSEGMRQRLGLAAALLNNPRVLLLDEPLENLDDDMKTKVMEFMQSYAENGNIIFISTHIIENMKYTQKIEFPLRKKGELPNE